MMIEERGHPETNVLVPSNNGDSVSSNTKRSLEYQNSCNTGKDHDSNAIAEVTIPGANSANDDGCSEGIVDVRFTTDTCSVPSLYCLGCLYQYQWQG